MIELDMKDVVRNARIAYDNENLQAQTCAGLTLDWPGGCLYSGPCAIGVSLTPEEQRLADNPPPVGSVRPSSGIRSLSEYGIVKFSDSTQLEDAINLQYAHDNWAVESPSIGGKKEKAKQKFLYTLVCLEEIYL